MAVLLHFYTRAKLSLGSMFNIRLQATARKQKCETSMWCVWVVDVYFRIYLTAVSVYILPTQLVIAFITDTLHHLLQSHSMTHAAAAWTDYCYSYSVCAPQIPHCGWASRGSLAAQLLIVWQIAGKLWWNGRPLSDDQSVVYRWLSDWNHKQLVCVFK